MMPEPHQKIFLLQIAVQTRTVDVNDLPLESKDDGSAYKSADDEYVRTIG